MNPSQECKRVTDKYITLNELKNQIDEKRDEVEGKAIETLGTCYTSDFELCLLILRRRHEMWGERTLLQIVKAENEICEKLICFNFERICHDIFFKQFYTSEICTRYF